MYSITLIHESFKNQTFVQGCFDSMRLSARRLGGDDGGESGGHLAGASHRGSHAALLPGRCFHCLLKEKKVSHKIPVFSPLQMTIRKD